MQMPNFVRYLMVAPCVALLSLNLFAEEAEDCSAHIFWQHGNVPILLTSPHGASRHKLLSALPARQGVVNGEKVRFFVSRADAKTDVVTHGIAEKLMSVGLRPFMVVAGIHRSQIDFNRAPNQAYDDERAIPCYTLYHQKVRQSVVAIRQQWKYGFMLDVHGQSLFADEIIRGTRNQKTIQQLISRHGVDVSEAENGFYRQLREMNYDVQPAVGGKERYYYGGYTLQRYGSHHANGIDALQIEIGHKLRVNTDKRLRLIDDIAQALEDFYIAYYQ
ncbi:MAG: N-formylglutamate amidohydrolase [Kiritimatiellia bacterium]|jgi:N-formylglutamate amidohydrolase